MNKPFDIQNDTVFISNLNLSQLQGAVVHSGSLEVLGNTNLRSNLNVIGDLTVKTLKVDNLITNSNPLQTSTNWSATTEADLEGKGLSWTWGKNGIKLIYRAGNKLWTNSNIDLAHGNCYKIDDIDVIGFDYLGSQITNSNLTKLGTLESLDVSGNTSLGQFAFFNEALCRVGLNTEEPNGVLSVAENNVEFIIAAPNYGVATVGTYTNSDISIITDNTPRFTVKNSGEVVFGSALTNSAVVTINGTLNVTTLLSDTRIDSYSPIEFKASTYNSVYGLGLRWTGTDVPIQFVLMPNPDRLFSTESIDLAANRSYFINEKAVLTETSLGSTVKTSNLTTVGVLQSLTVSGDCLVGGNITSNTSITSPIISISDNSSSLTISSSGMNLNNSFAITSNDNSIFAFSSSNISIGDKLNVSRAVNLYGKVGINVTSVDPSVSLEVNGAIKFSNKKFITGSSWPLQGTFVKGDICWNDDPIPGSYIGWVCIVSGTPGQWSPFGSISQQ